MNSAPMIILVAIATFNAGPRRRGEDGGNCRKGRKPDQRGDDGACWRACRNFGPEAACHEFDHSCLYSEYAAMSTHTAFYRQPNLTARAGMIAP